MHPFIILLFFYYKVLHLLLELRKTKLKSNFEYKKFYKVKNFVNVTLYE